MASRIRNASVQIRKIVSPSYLACESHIRSRTPDHRTIPHTFLADFPGAGLSIVVNKLVILSILQLAMPAAILFILSDRDQEPDALHSGQSIAVRPEATPLSQPAAAATLDAGLIREIVRSEPDDFAARSPAPQ